MNASKLNDSEIYDARLKAHEEKRSFLDSEDLTKVVFKSQNMHSEQHQKEGSSFPKKATFDFKTDESNIEIVSLELS